MTVSTHIPARTLTTSLGVTSLALGASEIASPDAVARLAGVVPTDRTRRALRLLGVREWGHGAAILAGSPKLVWTRVVGDVLDVTLLARALAAPGADRRRGALAMGVLAVIGAADAWAAKQALGV